MSPCVPLATPVPWTVDYGHEIVTPICLAAALQARQKLLIQTAFDLID